MRVTKIPGDPNFDDRPRRVTLNEQAVEDWTVADMFRRVVETPAGPKFGAVWIEPLPAREVVDQVQAAQKEVDIPAVAAPNKATRRSKGRQS